MPAPKAKRRSAAREMVDGVTRIDWDSGKKPCPNCGLRRNIAYAATGVPCAGCGHVGMARIQGPTLLDEEGEWHEDADGNMVLRVRKARPLRRELPSPAAPAAEVKTPKAEPPAVTVAAPAPLSLDALFLLL